MYGAQRSFFVYHQQRGHLAPATPRVFNQHYVARVDGKVANVRFMELYTAETAQDFGSLVQASMRPPFLACFSHIADETLSNASGNSRRAQ